MKHMNIWTVVILTPTIAALMIARIIYVQDHPVKPKDTTSTVISMATVHDDTCGHAVVCGGVHNRAELKAELSDPAVVATGQKFIIDGAVLSVLSTDAEAHVAYRKKGHIYFTTATRTIKAGEPIWMDRYGHTVLVHCGNILEYKTPTDTSDEPLDIYPLNLPDGIVTNTPAFGLPETPEIASEVPNIILPDDFPIPPAGDQYVYVSPNEPDVPCCGIWVPEPPIKPAATPEPVSMVFMGTGMVGLAILRKRRTKHLTKSKTL